MSSLHRAVLPAALSLLAPFAAAQDTTAPARAGVVFGPQPGWMLCIDASGDLETAFFATALGKLVEDPAIKPTVDALTAEIERRQAHIEELQKLVDALPDAGTDEADDVMRELLDIVEKLADVRPTYNAQIYVYPPKDAEEEIPSVIAFAEPAEADAETWDGVCDQLLAWAKKQRSVTGTQEVEIAGGNTMQMFRLDEDRDAPFGCAVMARTGRQVIFGFGDEDRIGTLEKGTPESLQMARRRVLGDGGAGFLLHVDVAALLETARKGAGDADEFPEEILRRLGLLDVKTLTYGAAMVGEHIHETVQIGVPGGPEGLLAALGDPSIQQPTVPLPGPALMHMSGGIDMRRLWDTMIAVRKVDEPDFDPDADAADSPIKPQDVFAAFTGGAAFGISAGLPGGFPPIPRLAMALGIADSAAFDKLEAAFREAMTGIEFGSGEHKGIEWTSVQVPNSPVPFVFTYAVHDGVLYVGSDPRVLKNVLDGLLDGTAGSTGIDLDGAPLAFLSGAETGGMRVEFDPRAIYTMIGDDYMPVIQLGINNMLGGPFGGAKSEPLIDAGEMPRARDVVRFFGPGLGGMRRNDDGIELAAASSLGGPLTAIVMSLYIPLMPTVVGMILDQEAASLEDELCQARLKQVWAALRSYRTAFGQGKTLPRDLGTLLTRGLIDDESVFVVPGDDEPLVTEYEDEEGEVQQLSTSFRYLADGRLKVSTDDIYSRDMIVFERPTADELHVVLYEANESSRGSRYVVTDDGTIWQLPESSFRELIPTR
ncbi:MAG: hypothetical protein IPM29_22785 [Planctomycetes bacterium]|nr:hypothetical protein [Planctomycetota bacterium]